MGAIVMAGDPGFWDVAWNWPLPLAVAVLAVPMAGIIWFICQLRYKQQIATLKDRVELADERLGDAKEKIVKAEEAKTALHTTVKELNAQIEKLKKRKMGQWLTERFGQPFIIVNRPGAGTNIAAEVVVNAPPDGYTLFFANVANAVNATLYEKLNFDFIRDITPVAGIMRVPNILAVSPSVPAKTVPELIAYAKPIPAGSTWRRPGLEPQGIWPVSCSR
jgi:Tripartite tricarboxylate transporter family receptor